MEKVKKFFVGFIDAFRGIYTRIPITFFAIILCNICAHILAFMSEHEKLFEANGGYQPESPVWYIMMFSIFFALGTFFTEIVARYRECDTKPAVIFSGTLISALISFFISYKILGYFFITKSADILESDNFTQRTMLCVTGYVIILICISIYLCINKSGVNFFEYAMRIFVNYFQIYVISIVMLVGTGLVVLILEALFFRNSKYDIVFEVYSHCALLIGGMYALPFSVYSLIHSDCEIGRFMEILVKYVMHIISLIAYVIIYIYMIKVLVLKEIPSNSIFAICTALFVCSMIIAIMCLSFEVNGFLQKTAFYLPYIFAPFILLQAYSVIVRIKQYGVTPSRYAGVVFIIFEVLYIVIYFICMKKNRPMQSILLAIAILVTISAFVPQINMLTASKNSQVKIIKKYISEKDASPSDELVRKAYGAASYIIGSDYGRDYLYTVIKETDYESLKSLKQSLGDKLYNEKRTISGSMRINDVDISGYDRMYVMEGKLIYPYYDENGICGLDNIVISTDSFLNENPETFTLNLTDKFYEFDEASKNGSDNVLETCGNEVELSDSAKLFISRFTTSVDVRTGRIPSSRSISLDGFILVKEKEKSN